MLYDEVFDVIDTPIPAFPGRLVILDFFDDLVDGSTGSHMAFGGQTSISARTGAPCPSLSCVAVYFDYFTANTPVDFEFTPEVRTTWKFLVPSRPPFMCLLSNCDSFFLRHRAGLSIA